MPDSDELARMMVEISAGWEWGDPRSEVLQTPEHEAKWGRLKVQMKEIADKGGIVDIPSGFPDLTGHREKWPQPPRDAADAPRPESKRQAVKLTGQPPGPKTPKGAPEPESGQIVRSSALTDERLDLTRKDWLCYLTNPPIPKLSANHLASSRVISSMPERSPKRQSASVEVRTHPDSRSTRSLRESGPSSIMYRTEIPPRPFAAR